MKFVEHVRQVLGEDYQRLKIMALVIIYAYIMAFAGLCLSYDFPIPHVDILQRAHEVDETGPMLLSFSIWAIVSGATVFLLQLIITRLMLVQVLRKLNAR